MSPIIPAPLSLATQASNAAPTQISLTEARRFCRQFTHSHDENFSVVSFLVPRHLRKDFYAIYAYCRHSDDLGDASESPAAAAQSLGRWRNDLTAAIAGESVGHPILRALADTIARRSLSTAPFFHLLTAFERDQVQTRYATHEDLHSYCRCSADPVGRILLDLAGVADAEALRRGDKLCTGLQLINFCQDMHRDAAIGRIYMPRELYEPCGVDEAMILDGQPTAALRESLRRWVAIAREHLLEGRELHRMVPRWLRRDVLLFAGGGLAVCEAIERQGYDVWTRRPTVGKWAKARLLAAAMFSSAAGR